MNIGAFFSISGMTKNLILLPRMYAFSSWFTRPSCEDVEKGAMVSVPMSPCP